MQVLGPDDIDFESYMIETDAQEKVRPAVEYLDDVMHEHAPAHEENNNPRIPFANAWLYFNPGEVSLWAGYNNSGKSAIQGQVLAHFARQGHKTAIASLEMKPGKTLARMVSQHIQLAHYSREQAQKSLATLDEKMWLYNQRGTVESNRMIAVIRHCSDKLKCTHVAVDSLLKCVRGTDDYNAQKDFVDRLTACARDLNIHIHLVVHLKKGGAKNGGDDRLPNRFDIKGASEISDLVDNVIMVWRNEQKELAADAGCAVDQTDPDSMLIVDKQRNGDWEGRIKLWYDRTTFSFFDYNRSARRGLAQALNENRK